MEKLAEKIEELPFPEGHEKKVELRGIMEKLQKGIDDLEEEVKRSIVTGKQIGRAHV